MTRLATPTAIVSPLLVAAAACAFLALTPGASAAKPKPGDNGLLFCGRNNDRSIGDISYDTDTRQCCYWQRDGKGGALRVCLKCDSNWKNCKESTGARAPNLSTAPSNLEQAPKTGGFGTKPRGRTPHKGIRIERE